HQGGGPGAGPSHQGRLFRHPDRQSGRPRPRAVGRPCRCRLLRGARDDFVAQLPRPYVGPPVLSLDAAGDPGHWRGLSWAGHLADGDAMVDVKAEVRALLDRLPDDCSYADVQRGIAVLMWPKHGDGSLKPPERLPPEE